MESFWDVDRDVSTAISASLHHAMASRRQAVIAVETWWSTSQSDSIVRKMNKHSAILHTTMNNTHIFL